VSEFRIRASKRGFGVEVGGVEGDEVNAVGVGTETEVIGIEAGWVEVEWKEGGAVNVGSVVVSVIVGVEGFVWEIF